jgi:hypothetical protein
VKKLGADHPSTLATLNNLAAAYWRMNQLDKSIPLLEQTLAVQWKKLGELHPNTLGTLAFLGVNYRDTGRLAEGLVVTPRPRSTWHRLRLARQAHADHAVARH